MGVVVDGDATVVLGLVSAFVWAAFRVWRRVPMRRILIEGTFAGCMAAVAAVTIISYWGMGMISRSDLLSTVNVVPFRTVFELARPETLTQAFRQLLGNIAMFIPFGLLLPLLNDRCHSLGSVVVTAVAVSAGIESVQLVLHLLELSARSVDVDDVILNTLGAVIGWLIWRLAASSLRRLATVGWRLPSRGPG